MAADPTAFAAAIVRAYTDAALWDRLSSEGLAYAEHTLSLSAWQKRLDFTLHRIGF